MSFSAVMDDIVKKLKSNPLYWASLGSRELFHSNFLGWLFEQYPSSLKAIFDVDFSNFKIIREAHNIDLIVKTDNNLIAIENKFKDVPKVDQLKKYDDVIDKHFKDFSKHKVLLSLVPATQEISGWDELLYSDLITRLEVWLDTYCFKIYPNHKSYIADYISMVRNINCIVEKFTKRDDYWFGLKNSNEFDSLKSIRFEDTITKHLAGKFCNDILSHLNNIDPGVKFHSEFGMNNKSPSVDFIISTAEDYKRRNQNDITFFIQIEGNTYRRAIEYKKWSLKSVEEGRDEVYLSKKLKELNFETDLWIPQWKNCADRLLAFNKEKNFKTSLQRNKSYNSYSPGFIYRYFNIGGENGMPRNELFNFIEEDIKLASELIKKVKSTN